MSSASATMMSGARVVSITNDGLLLEISNEMMYRWILDDSDTLRCLNEALKNDVVMLRDCTSLRERLRRKLSRVNSKVTKATRHHKDKFLKGSMELNIFTDEIQSAHRLCDENQQLQKEVEEIR